MASRFVFPVTLALSLISFEVRADETAGAPPAAPEAPAQAAPAPQTSKPRPAPRNPKGKHAREKEIEGSEARNRFQADTVLKSKYQLNGEPLEVDPD